MNATNKISADATGGSALVNSISVEMRQNILLILKRSVAIFCVNLTSSETVEVVVVTQWHAPLGYTRLATCQLLLGTRSWYVLSNFGDEVASSQDLCWLCRQALG